MRDHRVIEIAPLKWIDEMCSDELRALFERALVGVQP
jgi:hypothetical protein